MIYTLKLVLRWLRTPLEPGPRWATVLTLLWAICAPAIVMVMPWDSGVQIVLVLASIGVLGVLLGATRPRYFWMNGIVEGWRWAFGDRGVVIIYLLIGLGLVAGALIQGLTFS